MFENPKVWRPVAAAVAAGALALSLISPALAQETENQPPAPMDDEATTSAGVAVQIDVLANDADPDGQGIHISEWGQPGSGSVDVVDAIAVYTPAADFSGTDTFEYTVSDGDLTASATVTVTVQAAAQAPEAVDDTATTTAGTAVVIDVLANDTAAEGMELTVESATQPANGTTALGEDGITYTPAADFVGTDTFDYTITDGTATATGTVTVTVEDAATEAPEAIDDTASTTAGVAVEIDVLANDTGADGVELTVESVTQPASGTAAIAEGVVVYTPEAGFTGTDTFDYTITDGEVTATGTVTVTVGANADNLDPRVVEACEAYEGDDATAKILCRVYLSGTLSPFVQQIVGSIILITIPAPEPDPVMVACEAHAGSPAVDALCGLYQQEDLPEWLKERVGQLILRLTDADGGSEEGTSSRGRGGERGHGIARR